jgi:hypothetical protein
MRRAVELQRRVQAHGVVGGQLDQEVGGEDLRERAEAQQRCPVRDDAAAGSGLTVAVKEDLVVADDDEDHAGRAGFGEEVGTERAGLLQLGQRCGVLGVGE